MRGALGEKIGEGAFSDVHAWAPNQVIKLFKADAPRRMGRWEARMTRAVFDAGGPAPEVLGEVTVEGRFGIVLPRLDGPTLYQLTRSGDMTFEEAGAIIASLARSVHDTPPPPNIPMLRDMMDGALRDNGDAVPKHIVTGILAYIDRLRPGDGLCHSDLHTGNVIMTADGPRLVDWTGAVRAPAAFDLGSCRIALTEIAPEFADNPQRPRAIYAAALSEYARLAGMSEAALAAATELYSPINRVLTLNGGSVPTLREQLIQRSEAALRAVN